MLFFGLLTFLFLIIIRPQDFVLFMSGMPIVYVVMGVMAAGWLFSSVEKRLLRTAQDKYFALFFSMIVVSTLNANYLSYTKDIAIETLKIALIYWFCVTIVNNEERLKAATWATVVFMTVVAAMGVFQHFGHDITGIGMAWAPDKEVWQIRGAGLFDNPNDLAYSVVLVLPFTLGLFFASGNPLVKSVAFSMFLTAIYCIYLTKSRGGYLAATIGIATWFYFWVSSQSWRRAALVLGVIVVVAAFSMQTKNYRDDESSMGRVESWTEGMKLLSNHPLIGVGKGQFLEYHKLDTHNSYVRAGAELGFIGLYAFIGILYSAFRTLKPDNPEDIGSDLKIYRVGLLAYLASYAVGSIFSTRTYDIIFMVIIAFTGVMARFSLDMRQIVGVEIAADYEEVLNKKVLGLAVFIIVIWKLFLIQVW